MERWLLPLAALFLSVLLVVAFVRGW